MVSSLYFRENNSLLYGTKNKNKGENYNDEDSF